MEFVLVLILLGPTGGNAMTSIRSYYTEEQCATAGKDWVAKRPEQRRIFDCIKGPSY